MPQWFIKKGQEKVGPVKTDALQEKARTGELLPTDYIKKVNAENWVQAKSLTGLQFKVVHRDVLNSSQRNKYTALPPSPSIPPNPFEMSCRSCGKRISKRADFCVHCGYVIGAALTESEQEDEDNHHNPLLEIVPAGLLMYYWFNVAEPSNFNFFMGILMAAICLRGIIRSFN